jgi:hypothetical protein
MEPYSKFNRSGNIKYHQTESGRSEYSFWELKENDFGKVEIGCALIAGGGGSVFLPLLVGRSRALEIIAGSED